MKKSTFSFCHTMSVVMSPNGLNAPPAFAAITTLMQPSPMNRDCPTPAAMSTAHMSRAVVRLSANGEITNDNPPVIQKMAVAPKPRRTIQARRLSNTPRSSIELT